MTETSSFCECIVNSVQMAAKFGISKENSFGDSSTSICVFQRFLVFSLSHFDFYDSKNSVSYHVE